MKIREFGVERWMDQYENHCELNLAETCVESLTVEELLDLAGKKDAILADVLPMRLTYGAIDGTERLRSNVASLYEKQAVPNVLITHGAISANALVYETLVEPGDHVISVLPTYQQHYSIPESYGAQVEILRLRPENGFLPDLDELKRMIRPDTRLIAINNPNNPTGSLMERPFLEALVAIARSCGAYILCDEVYRGTDQHGDGFTASVADLYEKGISTGSMSKTWSLAGLRVGWIVAPVELIGRVQIHRDYNTISVGMLNDLFASIALENRAALLKRNHEILRTNLAVLDAWIAKEPVLSYVKPKSGTTALVRVDLPVSSRDFCVALLEKTGVMFTPGSALDMEGYVRIGYTNSRAVLEAGLARVSEFLTTYAASR
ncbi:aminotransferase [Paraburkholderia megapolitana]|uniref:Aminotransferase n=1 Tax=Paraburkholderia megapolitana TaxID=420953 RepID=A0A1I3LE66_9BURK|nr:aminotransferase [Paraburkholderia megapolitana]QDQ80669.1 aminotransferase [Paraburkholderia megapolitana]SFI82850.1 Aspartate/methionine/tyrosine aminotransferase [Paraburkholderia megapolitana]